MRSDFIATISRVERDSITTQFCESQVEALDELLGNWDSKEDKHKTIGESIVQGFMPVENDEILSAMLTEVAGEDLKRILEEAEHKMDDDNVQDFVKLALDAMTNENRLAICKPRSKE